MDADATPSADKRVQDDTIDPELFSWIQINDRGVFSSTRFDNLYMSTVFQHQVAPERDRPTIRVVARGARNSHADWSELLTLIAKVEWMRSLTDDQLSRDTKRYFIALDIQLFHVLVRSAMDHLAAIVSVLPKHRGRMPEDSFKDVLAWVANDATRTIPQLGADDRHLLEGASEWFLKLRGVRDQQVHRDSMTMVFDDASRIPFQVMNHTLDGMVQAPGEMFNENLADFQVYASRTLARLWTLLDRASQRVFVRLALPQVGLGMGVSCYHGGLGTLKEWLELGVPDP